MAETLRAIKICQLKCIFLFNSRSNAMREVPYLTLKTSNPSRGELRDDSRPQIVSGRGGTGTLILTSESVFPTFAKQEMETRKRY